MFLCVLPTATVLVERIVRGKTCSTTVFLSTIPMTLGIVLSTTGMSTCVLSLLHLASFVAVISFLLSHAFSWVLCVPEGEINFHWFGFLCLLVGLITRALKSVQTAQLMQDYAEEERLHPIELLFHMGPPSLVLLMILCLIFEGPSLIRDPHFDFLRFGSASVTAAPHPLSTFARFIGSGFVAALLNLSNFTVTQLTGAVTLQVIGNLKLAASILFSWLIFRNQISPLCWLGLVICAGGVIMYQKGTKAQAEQQKKQPIQELQQQPRQEQQQEELLPMLQAQEEQRKHQQLQQAKQPQQPQQLPQQQGHMQEQERQEQEQEQERQEERTHKELLQQIKVSISDNDPHCWIEIPAGSSARYATPEPSSSPSSTPKVEAMSPHRQETGT